MTQENKQLLIKDLCARLPYRIKALILNDCKIADIISYNRQIEMVEFRPVDDIYLRNAAMSGIKPYLFPLSSMSTGEKREYFNICQRDWIDNKSKDIGEMEVLNKGIDWLNEHLFDYRGLIDKGLAIDATNLNIY